MLSTGIIEQDEWRWVFVFSAALVILLLLPFVVVYGIGGVEHHFMGILVNPIDGISYLAKMYEGQRGEWLFTLPYTPEVHRGVIVYTFYIALGHLARVLDVPLILVFHVTRIIGGMLLFLALYRFVADWTDDVAQRRITWGLATLGAGFGWLAVLFGHVTPDVLTLPEAFPLQAVYANAHFPWSIAALVTLAHVLARRCLAEEVAPPELSPETAMLAVCAIFLVSVSPFALVPVGLGIAAYLALRWWRTRKLPRSRAAWASIVLIFGLPLGAYTVWAFSGVNPVFQEWLRQNVTPSPPVWDYLIAFGPLLALAGLAIWQSRRSLDSGDVFLLVWLASTILLLYAPFGMQRRFSMGVIAPLAVYAGRGLWRVVIPALANQRRLIAIILAYLTFLPTTLLVIVSPIIGSFQLLERGGQWYFTSQAENEAMDWLEDHAPGALVLASPEIGLFLPTHGLRVVYGHPFETLDATARKQAVLDFYAGADCSVADSEGVEYVLVGPRERALTGVGSMCPVEGEPVFESGDGEVAVYAVSGG